MALLKFVLLGLFHSKFYGLPYLQMYLAYFNFCTHLSKPFASEGLCSPTRDSLGDGRALSRAKSFSHMFCKALSTSLSTCDEDEEAILQSMWQHPKHHTIKLLCRPVCEQTPWIEARSQKLKQDHTQWTAELVSSFSLTLPSRGSSTYPYK